MTFRCGTPVQDGRKSVLAAKGKFWSVREREREREREGEWQTRRQRGQTLGQSGRRWGRDHCDDPLATTKVRRNSQQKKKKEEEESGVSISMASLNTSMTVFLRMITL
jgi:hypothetical protein